MEIGGLSPTNNFFQQSSSASTSNAESADAVVEIFGTDSTNDSPESSDTSGNTPQNNAQDDNNSANENPLADPNSAESRQLDQLQARDREVRAHEQAHLSAAGTYARSSASFEYQKGPDGNRYAVGGEVSIDASEVSGDPAATIVKLRTVRAAALAPASPSGQDRSVASQASQGISQATVELAAQKREEARLAREELDKDTQDENDNSLFSSQQNDNVSRYTDIIQASEATQQNVLNITA